ncbi:MAG: hypothetical protein B6U94_00635 [Thermofilum sp. ex4484_79]|nr:MAG: hypothetical protein B6U94_00635 [Thermofilum sp. ex4484_79]
MPKMPKQVKRVGEKTLQILSLLLYHASNSKVVTMLILLLTFSIALLLRLTPMKWGIYLNEFDPYYEYYLAEKVIEHSKNSILDGIIWWFSWWFDKHEKDTLFWAPFGRDLRRTSQPGAALFSSTIYWILNRLGFDVSLYTVHAFVPPIGAATAVFIAYLLGKEIKDERVGVFSALMISLSWSYIYRTNFGAKHEGIAIPFMLLGFYLFLKAYRKSSNLYSILAGLSFGMVVLSWGAYLYPWNLIALIGIIWLILHPSDVRFAKVFFITNIITQLFIAITPRFGSKIAFYSVVAVLPIVTSITSLLVIIGHFAKIFVRKNLRIAVLSTSIALTVVLLVAWKLGAVSSIAGRILAIVVPIWREVGVTTVAEHAIPGWASFYSDYSTIILFAIFGGLIAFLRAKHDLPSMFSALLIMTSAYAASSMARLTLLLAPSIALLGTYGYIEILDSVFPILCAKEKYRTLKRRKVSKEPIVVSLIIITLLLLPPFINARPIVNSHQPPLILSSSIPLIRYNYEYTDWLSALEWIKNNIPENTIIATWWDYGYWISVNTRRKTTCDNATLDTKQIQRIARAFLSSEDEALKIFKELGVEYVVVYEPFQAQILQYFGIRVYYSVLYPALGGDLAKSVQMARWIGEDPAKYIYGYGEGKYAYIEVQGRRIPLLVPANTPEAKNATLYHLLFVKMHERTRFIFEPFFSGQPIQGYNGPVFTIPQPKHFKLVYASQPNGWVLVFKVLYNTTSTGNP